MDQEHQCGPNCNHPRNPAEAKKRIQQMLLEECKNGKPGEMNYG